MLRKTKWALCLVACLLIANVYAGGGESCPDGTTQYGDKCCENGKCCHASVNSKRCSAICCESGVIVTNVNLDTNNPNCAGWSNPHDNYGTETCTSPGSTFCQYSGRETGNCKGSQCGIAGTINYRETWKDSQCTYHETNSDISCKSVNELTASTTTISPPRNHEPVGPEVLVVSGCSGAGCANGQCNCNGVNNWRAAATWGCAPLGAPIVKYLSQQWNLQNVWQPAVTLSWREYPLGFDDVQYTNNLVRPNPSSSAWPTTTRTFYIVNNGVSLKLDEQPTVKCDPALVTVTEANFFGNILFGNIRYDSYTSNLQCSISYTPPANLSTIFGKINFGSIETFTLKATLTSEANVNGRDVDMATFSFVYPAAKAWNLALAADKFDSNGFLSNVRNLGWQSTPQFEDFTVTKLEFRVSCTMYSELLASPGDLTVWTYSQTMPTANGFGFYKALDFAAGVLKQSVWEATCDIQGQAFNGNPIATFSNPKTVRFGILKARPEAITAPSHASGDSNAPVFWTVPTSLYTTWANCFRGNTKVVEAMKQAYPGNTFWATGGDHGIFGYTLTTMLDITSKDQSTLNTALRSYFPGVPGPVNIMICVESYAGNEAQFKESKNPLITSAMEKCRLSSALFKCVDCFTCKLSVLVTASDAVGNSTSSVSPGVKLDLTPPVITGLTFATDKKPLEGTLFYARMTDVKLSTAVYEPEAPLSSVVLNMAVADFTQFTNSVPNIFGTLPFGKNVNYATGALAVDAASWNGKSFHGQPYVVQIQATSAAGLVSSRSSTVIVDGTPPSSGYVRFNQSYYDPTVTSAVSATFGGIADLESGIKEFYYRWGSDNSFCTGADFALPLPAGSKWQPFSLPADADAYAPDEQTVLLKLGNVNASKVYLGIAGVNRAATAGSSMSQSVSFSCSLGLVVDSTGPSIDINSIEIVQATLFNKKQYLSGVERTVTAKWCALASLSGVSYYNASLYFDDKLAVGPSTWYTNSATLSYKESGPLPASTKVKLCVTAMSYAHRVVGPVCQDTLINTVEPDFSTCSTAGMTLPTSANSMATLQLDWMSCVSATYMVDHYEYNIVKNGQIEYGGKRGILSGNTTSLALPLNSTVVIGKIVVCLTPVDMFGDSHQPFCTNPVTIDSTVPMPTGGVRNIDPATKLPIQTTTSLTGLSVGWDAWQDAATFISNYTVTITAMSLNKTESVFAGPVTLSTVDLKPHADGTFSHDFSGYRVVVGSTYTASIYATNAAGLSSGPTNSSGIKAVDPALFPDPVVTILDGIVLQTQSTLYRLIPQGKDQKLHITWQKFRGFSGANRVSYAVQFVSELDNQASNITVGSSLDALVAIPSNPGAYRVYVNLLLTDGANATTIAKTALAPEKLIISETIGFTPGVGESSCDVQFDVSSVSVPRPAATLQAKWPKFVDTYGLISNYRLAFRRQGQTFRTSSWSEVGSSSQSFAGKVAYPYGVPNMLTPWQLECVIEAVDVANRSSSITVPARWTTLTTPKNKAAVVSVPLTKLSQTPANSSDFGFLEEITMTAGGDMTFAAAFFGFPQLQSSGTQLATVQYSVGNAMSNTTGIFDNIIPLTALDLSGATNQSMLIEGTYVPVHMFAVPITYLDATPVSVCVNVTVQATSESVFTCSAGVAADSNPPAVGTTEISLGAQYATTSSSLVITWDGFTSPSWLHPNGSGIAFYQWTLGTYPGGDDIVSATRSYPSAGRALVTGIKLLNGYSYFATVIATADNGLSSNATSDEVIIDYTPPRSASGITAIRPIQVSDKVWNVRIEYDHWTDLETRVASVTWVIETQYGYGDVLPATRTDTPTSAEAKNLQLGVGITYVVRVIATNTAGLAQESIRSFTVPYPVWILSLVDGAAIGRSLYSTKAYSTEKSIYNLSWRLLGSPLYAEYALGTRPMQNDIYPWTRVTSETEASIILTEQFNDGLTLYASMRAFGENGIIADVISTAGITFDESPPLVGRVIQGRGTVHKLWTMSSAIVSFSWTGFLDRHSGIARHHYCIDADPDPKRCASEMTEIYGSTGVYSAGLDTELVVGKKYYIKIRATNGAGLSSYGMSPPFKYDPSPPTLGLVTVHHPSSADFIPAAHGGALIYQDWSTVQVSWTGFSDSDSGIANYQVALAEQESGQLVQQFVSVGGSTLWRFTDADGLLLEDGKKYFAVVLATNGAGAVSQATSGSFIVDTEPPSGGKVEVDFNPNGISTTIDGFFDKTSEIVEYRILIGSFRGANDVAPTRVLQMGSGKDCNPCVETFPISLQENAMYFVTVFAVDAGGLSSAPVSIGQVYTKDPVLIRAAAGFTWNISAATPNVLNFGASSPETVTVTGYGLTNFVVSGGAVQPTFQCQFLYPGEASWSSASAQLTYEIFQVTQLDRFHAEVRCPPPKRVALNNQDAVQLRLVAPDGKSTSNPIRLVHKVAPTTWGSTSAVITMGLSNNMASAYRISRALFQMTWPNRFPAKSVAYYSISSFGSQLAIVPGDSFEWIFTIPRTLSNFEQFKAMTSVSFEVCPYFYGHGAEPRQNCLASSEIVFDNKPVKLNPAVQSQVPTGVRILGYGSAKGFLYEAVQFQPTDKNLAAEWKDSFEYAGSKKIDHYDMMIGNAPFESAVDVVRGLTSTSFNTSTALEVGVAYFVTITAWDEAGIPSLLSSAPITVDATAPTGGIVYDGNVTSVLENGYQSDPSSVTAFWRGFVENESVIAEFRACVWDGSRCIYGPVSTGIATSLMAGNLSLSPNSTYSVRVEACNGAGLWSDPAFSNGFRVDITPPVLKGMIFGTGGSIAKASVTEEKLSWTFVDTESPVVEYMVQLGSSPEGAQILPLTSVGRQSFLPLNGLEFAHNSTVYAMVIARNAADLRGVGTFGPVLIDLTPPVLQSPVTAMDGNDVVNVVDSVQINARWSFVDWETDIVEYKVALGSPSDRESYRNFASVGMNSMIRNVTVEVVEGAQMVVSVIAVNAAGLEANATSQTVRFTKAPPSNCSIILLDEQLRALTDAAIYKGITYLSPQTDIKAQLSCSAATLADIADISFRLAKDGGQMFDWVPIGPHDILTIESGGLPKLDTMTLEVRANNAAGLWSDFRSAPFRISSQQPVPGAVTLEWRNGTDAASAKNLVVAISAFKDANAPTYPVNHTLGVFSSDSVGAYNIYSLEALKPDSTGSLAPVVIPVTSSAKGRNFTAVVRGVGLLGLETRVITMLPGA